MKSKMKQECKNWEKGETKTDLSLSNLNPTLSN